MDDLERFAPFRATTYTNRKKPGPRFYLLDGMIPGTTLENTKERWVFLFPNGFGASVIRGTTTFGGNQGLFELAVIQGTNPLKVEMVDDDVLGWLTTKDVVKKLVEIEGLPKEGESMSDRDNGHTLTELQEARAEVDRLRLAIKKHRAAMAEYRGAVFDEELWQVLAPLSEGAGNE